MVRMIKYLATVLMLYSCCDGYLTSAGGIRSKKKYKKYLNKRANPNLVGIELNSMYQMLDFKFNEKLERIEEITKSNYTAYIFFKSNGNLYMFYKISKHKRLKPFDVNTAYIGYFIKDDSNKYKIVEYSIINCGSFSKNDFKINGDTLMISAGTNKGYRIWYYYVKKKYS